LINEDIIPGDHEPNLRKNYKRSRRQEKKGNEQSLGIEKILLETESQA